MGERLVSHSDVDMITFTGSTATGRRVAAAAAQTVKRVHLELGGKSAAIFLPDTNIDEAVSASTVSQVAKVLDPLVTQWHRRPLRDQYRFLIFDGVSVRIRLIGKVQRRVALCAYGITLDGKRELIEPHKGDKRYVRRETKGRFKETDDVGKSLAQDRRRKAKTASKPGQGDRGDRRR